MDVFDPRILGSILAALAGIITAIITGRNVRENTRLTTWLQNERREAEREEKERLARAGVEEDRQTRLDAQTWTLLEQYRKEVAGLRAEIDQMRADHKAELAAIRAERNDQIEHLQQEYDRLIRENGALRARVAELEYQLRLRPATEGS